MEERSQPIRVRFPRRNEVLGVVQQRLGGSRMNVSCFDGRTRLCRIPGRFKKKLWVRENDLVLVEPWEIGGEEKGDIIHKYRNIEVSVLKEKGFLKEIKEF